MAVHRFVLREVHDLHSRHSGVYSGITWSPFLSVVTPGPTSTTTPAPSWPKITGNSPSGSPPERVNSSVWQTPVALSSTSTSPALGPASSTVVTSRGWPAFQATAARVFILVAPSRGAANGSRLAARARNPRTVRCALQSLPHGKIGKRAQRGIEHEQSCERHDDHPVLGYVRIGAREQLPDRLTAPQSFGDRRSTRSEEHTSEIQSLRHLVCRLLLEKKKKTTTQ